MGSNGGSGPKPMSNMQGGNNSWKTWQSDDDIPQRKILIQHM
jgi:E1A/CREB-binding protein